MRLDVYLTEKGLVPSRAKAREWIEGGFVDVAGKTVTKPAFSVDGLENTVTVTGSPYVFVGRGGVKLDGAMNTFSVSPAGQVCADIGASTGGFTDCLLRRGAVKVFAVDSGSGQLADVLRADSRVINMEKCNARYLTAEDVGEPCALVVADVSFISQTYILPAVSAILRENGEYIGLIKPQFECGAKALDKHGIVRDRTAHAEAISHVLTAAREVGLSVLGLTVSSIEGGDGNREFLFHCRKADGIDCISEADILRTVRGEK